MYKCINNLIPANLCNLFVPRTPNYDFRKVKKTLMLQSHDYLRRSYSYSGTILWNNLFEVIHKSKLNSLGFFKGQTQRNLDNFSFFEKPSWKSQLHQQEAESTLKNKCCANCGAQDTWIGRFPRASRKRTRNSGAGSGKNYRFCDVIFGELIFATKQFPWN